MRFVNVAVTDVAALLQLNVFDSRRAALERIRRRGGARWRPGKSSSHGRFDEFAALRCLPASRRFVERLQSCPKTFTDGKKGEDLLTSSEGAIEADARGMNVNFTKRIISSFVDTELGKAMENEVIDQLEAKFAYKFRERQRCYQRTWTHPKHKSLRVHLIGRVDASFRDLKGRTCILEIKHRRHGFRAVGRHEIIQLKTYLTLAKCDTGVLLQSYQGGIRKKIIRRNDGWFYAQVKPAIELAAVQVARETDKSRKRQRSKNPNARKSCRSKGRG